MSKGSRRRPEDSKKIDTNWPFRVVTPSKGSEESPGMWVVDSSDELPLSPMMKEIMETFGHGISTEETERATRTWVDDFSDKLPTSGEVINMLGFKTPNR